MALKLDSNLLKRIATAVVLAPLLVGFLHNFPQHAHWLFILFFILSIKEILFLTYKSQNSLGPKLLSSLLATTYVTWGLSGFYLIYCFSLVSDAPSYLYYLVLIWTTDIGAYFIGRKFGGPKLWPKVSPKKTWSGAVGGLICAILIAALIAWKEHWGIVPILLAIVVSITGQLGDLLESAYKRWLGVKDSGNLLPGHGGVLDRLDSVFAVGIVLPIVLYFCTSLHYFFQHRLLID